MSKNENSKNEKQDMAFKTEDNKDSISDEVLGQGESIKDDVVENAEAKSKKEKEPKRYTKADLFKFIGLLAFFVLMGVVVYLIWPHIQEIFTEGGLERVIERVRDAGAAGVFILLGMQFLQIVVAFIPGEVTQVAAGLLYGPWFGTLIILVGCVVSSAFIYMLVHKLGAPFVQSVVPTKYLTKFEDFEKKGKLNVLVFILFLIPGLPKDTFTYLVPLTSMRMRDFLVLSNIARIPGVFVSTFAADGLAEGRFLSSIIIFGVGAILCILGLVFREKLMDAAHKLTHNLSPKKKDEEQGNHEENADHRAMIVEEARTNRTEPVSEAKNVQKRSDQNTIS